MSGVMEDITWWIFFWHVAQKNGINLLRTFGKTGLLHNRATADALSIFLSDSASTLRCHTAGSSKWQPIVQRANQRARRVQLSISHFPVFISVLCLGSICSSIDLSIDHCPPLISMPVTCGGVQLIAQEENLQGFCLGMDFNRLRSHLDHTFHDVLTPLWLYWYPRLIASIVCKHQDRWFDFRKSILSVLSNPNLRKQ